MEVRDKISMQMVEDTFDHKDLESRAQSSFDQNQLYVFPGSMEKALIHRNANQLGVDVEAKYQLATEVCECCKKVIKDKRLNFFCLSENKYILKWGWGIPQYLTILKLNIILLTLVMLFYCAEFVVASYKLCTNLTQYQQLIGNIICFESFKMQIAPEIIIKQFFSNLKYGKFTALAIILGFLIIFYFYVQFFYRKQYLNQGENKSKSNINNLSQRSLLFLHFPDESQEFIENFIQNKIKEKFGKDVRIKIESICRIHNYAEYNKQFEKYIKIYEEMNVKKTNLTQQDIQQARNIKQKMDQIKAKGAPFSYRMIITFQSVQDCLLTKNALKNSFIYNIFKYFTIRRMTEFTTTEYYTIFTASHPQDYIWVNLGRSILQKIMYQTISIVVISSLIIGLGKALYDLTNLLNSMEGNNSKDIDSSTKITQYAISFGLFAIEKIVITFIKFISYKSFHFNKTSQFRFYLQYAITFLLAYYVTLPCILFFLISNDSLFAQQQQKVLRTSTFLTEMIVQVALSLFFYIFDYQYLIHYYKKFKIEKKYKQTGQIDLCQKSLNLAMQKPDFNLEKRFILLFKLLAFSGFFIFICPYSVIFILGGSVFLYLIDKYMIILRYSIYSYRSAKYIKSSATLITTWLFIIVISVFFLTEGEQINFNIIEGSTDNYNLSEKYYISLYVISGLFVIFNILFFIVYPFIKNKQKTKQAFNDKEKMEQLNTISPNEIERKLIPFSNHSSSSCFVQQDNNSYIQHYELFIKQFDCKILDDFYETII